MISLESDRERAICETGRSFAVEASAGTGKTSVLIQRILHLVLKAGVEGPPIRLSKIAAITFTEKAAGELKVRLRQEFEEQTKDLDIGERAIEALRDLETAAISTIHAFAVSLLKERPIEAGLDPHFTALDDIQCEFLFRQVFDSWLSAALKERHGTLEKALRGGLSLENIAELARTLRAHKALAKDWRPGKPPEEIEIINTIRSSIAEGESYLRQVRDGEDKLARSLCRALEWLKAYPQISDRLQKPGNAGSKNNWTGGKETVARVQEFISNTAAICETLSKVAAQRILHEVVLWLIAGFLPEWEKQKQRDALLDFDDLLLAARDLLKFNPSVRRYYQERFATILVDEFQDTDPVQLEIVLLLSSKDLKITDPRRLEPVPGRLFLVGDPKQSIYRFRGADIETYLEAVPQRDEKARSPERLELVTNFRSVPSILSFVDSVFSDLMKRPDDGSYQPQYLAFGGRSWRALKENAPAVRLLLNEGDGSDRSYIAADVVRDEAVRIARWIQCACGSEDWKIQERSKEQSGLPGGWRLPEYRDIAILLPVLTRVDALEDGLREAGIPYVLEGGKFYYARSEVSSAITLLRAAANPNDAVALYGALRSIFFGLSDEDLLRAHVRGLPFDYRAEVPRDSELHLPFSILRDLHEHRHERPASETFEVLLHETGAREVLAAHRGGLQSLANLGKLARTVRARQEEMTFSEIVEVLAATDEEEFDESESRIMEESSNAVRVMTIHKAKGLDFPIVFLAGLGLKRLSRPANFLAGPRAEKTYAIKAGNKESGFHTPNWDDLLEREKQRQDAELLRLLYVGMTRARDHLVVSALHKWRRKKDGSEEPDIKETRLERIQPLLRQMISRQSALARPLEIGTLKPAQEHGEGLSSSREEDWSGILKREYAELNRLICETPASRRLRAPAEHSVDPSDEDSGREQRLPDAAQGRAVRIGISFHEAMEAADFNQESGIQELAYQAGGRHGLDRAAIRLLEEMMRNSFDSELIGRARVAVHRNCSVLRELPFIRSLPSSGEIEDGKIDLLFEEDGEWVVVDYKTDGIPEQVEDIEAFFRERYSGQLRAYAGAVSSLGMKVKAAYLLLARSGRQIEILPIADCGLRIAD